MSGFQTGLDGILSGNGFPRGATVGLVAHAASVHAGGRHAADLLARCLGSRLRALFSPEHGWAGTAGAGEAVASSRHPVLGIPIHSLYGAVRRPTAEMLAGIDAIAIDLQDIGARCYTYVATLKAVLEAAAEAGRIAIVCDRPVPLPHAVDGPLPDAGRESFVAAIPAPMSYGMTPAETAAWLRRTLAFDLDLRLAPMKGWRVASWPSGRGAPPWVPPSPAIRSWACARAYLVTVWTEALPALDCARSEATAFQVLRAPWLDPDLVLERIGAIPGARLRRYPDRPGRAVAGLRVTVTDPRAFRPVSLAARLLAAIRDVHGDSRLWISPGARPDWFDELAGGGSFRAALRSGADADSIIAAWDAAMAPFLAARDAALLYRR